MTSCTNCSAPLAPDVRFCIDCGQPVAAQSITPWSLDVPSVDAQPAWAPQPVAQPSSGMPPPPPIPQTTVAPPPPPGPSLPTWNSPASTVSADAEAELGVRLAPGEVLKKVFPVVRVKKSMGWIEGQIAVTDSRLLYRAKAKNRLNESTNYREVQISDVSGMAMVTNRGLTPLSLLTLVVGFVIGWLAVSLLDRGISAASNPFGPSETSPLGFVLYLLLIIVTVIVGVVRFRSTEVALVVYARGIEASPIALSGSSGRQQAGFLAMGVGAIGGPLLAWAQALGLFDAADASDSVEPASAEAIYDELGALILDLQSRGVMGGE